MILDSKPLSQWTKEELIARTNHMSKSEIQKIMLELFDWKEMYKDDSRELRKLRKNVFKVIEYLDYGKE